MLHKNSKKALHGDNAPKSNNKMILQNHSLDQDKSFQKLLKFRTWLCLPCTLNLCILNMVCFTCGVYFGYFKKTVEKLISLLLLTIRKFQNLHLSFTQQLLVFIFIQLLISGGPLLICTCYDVT